MHSPRHTFMIEHLDPELEAWQALEYNTVYKECQSAGADFLLTAIPHRANFAVQLSIPPTALQHESAERLFPTEAERRSVCLLDPKGERDLSPEDGDEFNVFLFGGILGDDPPRDRTSELRRLGFRGRRLGPEQMTTDTAARVTRLVVQEKKKLHEIPYIDRPDILLPAHADGKDSSATHTESVSMPFKYVRGTDGKPIMPDVSDQMALPAEVRARIADGLQGMVELLASDADKGILDLL